MRRTLRVLHDVAAELESAAVWYEGKRRGLGVEFVALIDQALQAIVENPQAFTLWLPDRPYRKHPFKRFPYVVFFTVDSATVEIVAIAHARPRPGYWLGRRG